MVTLTRIYTRGGDKGETSLGRGERVAKHDLRVEAYGTVDEANSVIGLARAAIERTVKNDALRGHVDDMLERIQNDLFDLGADLCTIEGKAGEQALRIVPSQIERLEREIDAMNGELSPLTSFILPGGSAAAAWLHLARTVARRAERDMTALATEQPVNPEAIKYINRLSDHLFVLARKLNDNGGSDVLWVPAAVADSQAAALPNPLKATAKTLPPCNFVQCAIALTGRLNNPTRISLRRTGGPAATHL